MLRALRVRLSLLYLLASLGLVALLGAATYGMLTLYLQRSTDLALQYKMAIEFQARGMALPASLVSAEQAWSQGGGHTSVPLPTSTVPIQDEELGEAAGNGSAQPAPGTSANDGEGGDRYDGNLAPVFVVAAPGIVPVSGMPLVNDPSAIAQAQQLGSDLRTVRLDDGRRLRLLTYRIGDGSVLQVGRVLSDQNQLLSQYLTGLLILGSIASLVSALASWVLAGRSIKPAQRAWDQQHDFISNASHELRTPLTLVRASADYALRSRATEERELPLRDILDECDYMNSLVEDLLLLSRIDAQRVVLAGDLIALPELLDETVRKMGTVAAARGVSLRVDEVAGTVRGDRVRLRQVLLILLDNALGFTPPGGTIRLGSQVQAHEVVVHVIDSGTGIPAEDLPHVFERFYQVSAQDGAGRGNGLGLSIAQGLVEAHGGKIDVSSQLGQGTTVKVRLPAT